MHYIYNGKNSQNYFGTHYSNVELHQVVKLGLVLSDSLKIIIILSTLNVPINFSILFNLITYANVMCVVNVQFLCHHQ